jgi:hypothetical protein
MRFFLCVIATYLMAYVDSSNEAVCDLFRERLRPPRVQLQASVSSKRAIADQGTITVDHAVDVRRDDTGTCAVEQLIVSPEETLKSVSAYKHGEVVDFRLQLYEDETQDLVAQFHAPALAGRPGQPQPTVAQVFNLSGGVFPALGFFDYYHVTEYFPESSETTDSIENGIVYVESVTSYGTAEAWLDPARGHLPTRLKIVKGPGDLISRSRRLGDALWNKEDPDSAFTKWEMEMTVESFGTSPEGEPYIETCVTRDQTYNKDGLLVTYEKRWVVESISFEPAFDNGIIHDAPVSDGDRVSLNGASHLPYVWSEAEQWVVPASWNLANEGVEPHRIRVMALSMICIVLLIAVAVKHALKARSRLA